MRDPKRWTSALVVLLVALASAGGVRAQEKDSREVRARELFAMGKYADARDIYVKLYAETSHPTYLRNIGRCYQNLGEPDNAISSFREYLRQGRDITPDQRAQIERYVAEMEELKKRQAPSAMPPATASNPAARADTASPAAAGPAPTRPAASNLTAASPAPGESTTAPVLSAPARADTGGTSPTTIVGLSVAGAGLLGVAIGTVLGIEARSNNSEALKLCPTNVCDTQVIHDRHETLVSDAKRQKTQATVALAAGGAALVGGLVLALTAAPRRGEPMARAALWSTGREGGIVAVIRW